MLGQYLCIYLFSKWLSTKLIKSIVGLLWFEHNLSSTQMRRLTNLALTRKINLPYKVKHCKLIPIIPFHTSINREYPIRTDAVSIPNKFQAYRHKPLGQFSLYLPIEHIIVLMWSNLIPRWVEHRTYSYQKYTLPFKLRNPFIL